MNNQHEKSLARYVQLFETISPAALATLDEYFAPDARFSDPFNDVHGVPAIQHIFARMFETCLDVKFDVTHSFLHQDRAVLAWTMSFRPNVALLRKQCWEIPGTSLLHFAADGRVLEHVDYWDSGSYFYARLPIVGAIVRMLRKRAG